MIANSSRNSLCVVCVHVWAESFERGGCLRPACRARKPQSSQLDERVRHTNLALHRIRASAAVLNLYQCSLQHKRGATRCISYVCARNMQIKKSNSAAASQPGRRYPVVDRSDVSEAGGVFGGFCSLVIHAGVLVAGVKRDKHPLEWFQPRFSLKYTVAL